MRLQLQRHGEHGLAAGRDAATTLPARGRRQRLAAQGRRKPDQFWPICYCHDPAALVGSVPAGGGAHHQRCSVGMGQAGLSGQSLRRRKLITGQTALIFFFGREQERDQIAHLRGGDVEGRGAGCGRDLGLPFSSQPNQVREGSKKESTTCYATVPVSRARWSSD